MISLPIYKDVKKMSNAELVLEKEAICEKLYSNEKEKLLDERYSGWKEDESIIYAWNIERLEAILFEIKRRMQNAKWIFEEEHHFG